MLKKEEISSDHSKMVFLVPQVGREIVLRLGLLSELSTSFAIDLARELAFEAEPPVYHINGSWLEVDKANGIFSIFESLDDIRVYKKYIYFFCYKDFCYGYVRMTELESDTYLAECVTERMKPSFRDDDTEWYILKTSRGNFLLVNPHASGRNYASLYNSIEDMELEADSVKQFIEKFID